MPAPSTEGSRVVAERQLCWSWRLGMFSSLCVFAWQPPSASLVEEVRTYALTSRSMALSWLEVGKGVFWNPWLLPLCLRPSRLDSQSQAWGTPCLWEP